MLSTAISSEAIKVGVAVTIHRVELADYLRSWADDDPEPMYAVRETNGNDALIFGMMAHNAGAWERVVVYKLGSSLADGKMMDWLREIPIHSETIVDGDGNDL